MNSYVDHRLGLNLQSRGLRIRGPGMNEENCGVSVPFTGWFPPLVQQVSSGTLPGPQPS